MKENFPDGIGFAWNRKIWDGNVKKMFLIDEILVLTGESNSSYQGLILALDAKTGRELWRKNFPILPNYDASKSFFFPDFIVVQAALQSGEPGSCLLFFSPINGELVRTIKIPTTFPLSFFVHQGKFLLLAYKKVFLLSDDGTSIEVLSQFDFDRLNISAFHSGLIFSVERDEKTLIGIDPLSGKIKSRNVLPKAINEIISIPGGLLLVCNCLELYRVRPENQEIDFLFSQSLKNKFAIPKCSPSVCGRYIFWSGPDEGLHVFDQNLGKKVSSAGFSLERFSPVILIKNRFYYYGNRSLVGVDLTTGVKFNSHEFISDKSGLGSGSLPFYPTLFLLRENSAFLMSSFGVAALF